MQQIVLLSLGILVYISLLCNFMYKILHFVQNGIEVQNDIIVILSVSEGSIQQLFRTTKEL